MNQDREPNELLEIIKGFFLLLGYHIMAVAIVFVLGSVVPLFLVAGAAGFMFWQLLYVIPLTTKFKSQGQIGMMKGVIICAVLTALLNGACSYWLLSGILR
jgi:hypothetical protein